MKTYYFEVHEKFLLACWDCEADSWKDATYEYIKVLLDTDICEDVFDLNLHISIVQKLLGKQYEIDEDTNTLYLTFTEKELEQM